MTEPGGTDGSPRPERRYPGTPLWVKLFGLAVVALLVILVLVLVIGTALGLHTPPAPGGGHGR